MSKKILVAGAGHGGLTAAAYLAEKGWDVEVFEQAKREGIGHDWHDTMRNYTFELAGIKNVDKKDIHFRKDTVFYPPSLKVAVAVPETPPERVDYEVDRKVLYRYLIENAIAKGVKIHFETPVSAPLIIDGKVAGLIAGGKEIKGDLVIDSAGMYSPVMKNLPKSYGIRADYGPNDIFHTFRAYYNLVPGEKPVNPTRFNMYFKFEGIKGIAWFKVTEGMADVLVGSVEPINLKEVESVLSSLRKAQPALGDKLMRGGQIKDIPLKSTITLLVGDRYAAVGDSASMPLPMNGSGITNSIAAGKMLAETVLAAGEGELDAAALWGYQRKYFTEIGVKMAGIYLMKNCLLSYSVKALDFLFVKEILTAKELGAGSSGKETELTKADVMEKVKRGFMRIGTLLKIKNAGTAAKGAKEVILAIPAAFDRPKVEEWRRKVESYLK